MKSAKQREFHAKRVILAVVFYFVSAVIYLKIRFSTFSPF